MLESFLVAGRQDLDGAGELVYGQSITDGCIGWETTVEVLDGLADAVRARRRRRRVGAARGMRIAVLGVGLIGGSVALAARERLAASVAGYDASPAALERALERGALDRAARLRRRRRRRRRGGVRGGPGRRPARAGRRRRWPAAPPDCVVTDVGSTKRAVVAAHDDPRFVGGHPLAGAETAGVEHARADLFEGATWYLTPTPRTSGVLYERLHRLLHGLGARPRRSTPRPMTGSWPPSRTCRTCWPTCSSPRRRRRWRPADERLPATGPSFRDATRVAGAPSAIWTDIYLSNRDALTAEIDDDDRAVARGPRRAGARRRRARSRAWNEAAADDRRRLLEAQLAGGELFELRASVPNRPA